MFPPSSSGPANFRHKSFKTQVCYHYAKGKNGCTKGASCTYAHGDVEVEQTKVRTAALFKTRLCHFAQQGLCSKGENCNYAHDSVEVRQGPSENELEVLIMPENLETSKETLKVELHQNQIGSAIAVAAAGSPPSSSNTGPVPVTTNAVHWPAGSSQVSIPAPPMCASHEVEHQKSHNAATSIPYPSRSGVSNASMKGGLMPVKSASTMTAVVNKHVSHQNNNNMNNNNHENHHSRSGRTARSNAAGLINSSPSISASVGHSTSGGAHTYANIAPNYLPGPSLAASNQNLHHQHPIVSEYLTAIIAARAFVADAFLFVSEGLCMQGFTTIVKSLGLKSLDMFLRKKIAKTALLIAGSACRVGLPFDTSTPMSASILVQQNYPLGLDSHQLDSLLCNNGLVVAPPGVLEVNIVNALSPLSDDTEESKVIVFNMSRLQDAKLIHVWNYLEPVMDSQKMIAELMGLSTSIIPIINETDDDMLSAAFDAYRRICECLDRISKRIEEFVDRGLALRNEMENKNNGNDIICPTNSMLMHKQANNLMHTGEINLSVAATRAGDASSNNNFDLGSTSMIPHSLTLTSGTGLRFASNDQNFLRNNTHVNNMNMNNNSNNANNNNNNHSTSNNNNNNNNNGNQSNSPLSSGLPLSISSNLPLGSNNNLNGSPGIASSTSFVMIPSTTSTTNTNSNLQPGGHSSIKRSPTSFVYMMPSGNHNNMTSNQGFSMIHSSISFPPVHLQEHHHASSALIGHNEEEEDEEQLLAAAAASADMMKHHHD